MSDSEHKAQAATDEAAKKLTVRLTFFKDTGKWYSDAEYVSDLDPSEPLFRFWEEVQRLRLARDARTGLSSGGAGFYCLVNVPGHVHEHPLMLLPIATASASTGS